MLRDCQIILSGLAQSSPRVNVFVRGTPPLAFSAEVPSRVEVRMELQRTTPTR